MKGSKLILTTINIIALMAVLISCTNNSHINNPKNSIKDSNVSKNEPFFIESNSISNFIILKGIKKTVSGKMKAQSEAKELADILNSSVPYDGAVPANLYRFIEIHLKNESVLTLEFAGSGEFFHIVNSRNYYILNLKNKLLLNKLIDRIENVNTAEEGR